MGWAARRLDCLQRERRRGARGQPGGGEHRMESGVRRDGSCVAERGSGCRAFCARVRKAGAAGSSEQAQRQLVERGNGGRAVGEGR